MVALVLLENHFFEDRQKNIWCDRIINYNFLQRYLKVFEKIIVVGRCKYLENCKNTKLLVSGPNVTFVSLPEFVGIKGLLKNIRKINKIIEKTILIADCAIYRAPTHLSLFSYKTILKHKKPLALEFMMAADKMIEGKGFLIYLANSYIKNKTKKMCKRANGVSYVTKEVLQKEYPCRAILNGATKYYFTSSYSSIDLQEEDFKMPNWIINNPPKKFRIIHIGYMDSYRKGQDFLIKATKKVIESGFSIEVIFIGDGAKKAEFMKLANDLNLNSVVTFLGLIKDKKIILQELRKSHLFVFPTKSEGLPRTLIEAMAQGLPCIASPVDGIPELLKSEFLISDNKVDEYANKIIELLSNWPKMISISKDNYNEVQKYEKKNLDIARTAFYKQLEKICRKG